MMPKTYGDKPLVFAFDGDGEQYMIGSQVGNYLRLFSGHLYKKFPGLARRNLTNDERRKLIDMGHSQLATSLKSYNISLLLAREVEDLLAGRSTVKFSRNRRWIITHFVEESEPYFNFSTGMTSSRGMLATVTRQSQARQR